MQLMSESRILYFRGIAFPQLGQTWAIAGLRSEERGGR